MLMLKSPPRRTNSLCLGSVKIGLISDSERCIDASVSSSMRPYSETQVTASLPIRTVAAIQVPGRELVNRMSTGLLR